MDTGLIVAIVAVVVILGWVVWSKTKHREPAPPPRHLTLQGLGYVRWDEGITYETASRIASEMLTIQLALWPELESIYGAGVRYYLDRITLRDGPVVLGGKEHPVKLWLGPMVLEIDIHGGLGRSWRYWWAGELHNLYRSFAYGIDHVYMDEPNEQYRAATRAWQRYE